MARSRIELHSWLEELLGSDHVYFQPPESQQLEYPCIVYNLASQYPIHADDKMFLKKDKYVIKLICFALDYDGDLRANLEAGLQKPLTQVYARDELYHCIYELYY